MSSLWDSSRITWWCCSYSRAIIHSSRYRDISPILSKHCCDSFTTSSFSRSVSFSCRFYSSSFTLLRLMPFS